MEKYRILEVSGQEKEKKALFRFSLFASQEEIGKRITGIITSNVGSMPQNFQVEIQLHYGVEATHKDYLGLVDNLSVKVLQRYPEDHPKNQDAISFLDSIRKRV